MHISARRRHLLRCERGIAALEFALLAPALLMLAFGIIVYSIYFSTMLGVRQAATEGARAAMAGLSVQERSDLANDRADEVIANFDALTGNPSAATVTTTAQDDVFSVTVSYDISSSPIMRYASILPIPSGPITSTVSVTNGSY